jgi:hypothetical protein
LRVSVCAQETASIGSPLVLLRLGCHWTGRRGWSPGDASGAKKHIAQTRVPSLLTCCQAAQERHKDRLELAIL